ncbi:MAG TPA: condensation domain-containing protein, partial [Polyangia bacterium]|nr:condensation domain-containing protein [Polyangia bacterium]
AVAAAPPKAPAMPALAGDAAPLSLEQERLSFLDQLAPDSSGYNIATAVFLDGELDRDALRRSLETIVARHGVLRARYPRRDGARVQEIVAPALAASAFTLDDEAAADDAAALARAHAEARRPFDLERGPVLRARTIRVRADRHLLTLVVHHIAADGWSMGVMVRELSAAYGALVAGRAPHLPALPLQYADFAARQRQWLDSPAAAPALAYWQERLAGAPPLVALPSDRPRPSVRQFAGARAPFALGAAATDGLKRLAAADGATLYMTLLAGFAALVRQRSGRADLVFGTDVSGREQPDAQRLIGLFVNQLVMRIDASGDPTFRELVGRVRATALGAYRHGRLPLDRVVQLVNPARDPSYNPLFQLMFVLESAPLPDLELPRLRLQTVELDDGGSPFDLSLLLAERSGQLGGALRYDTALFDAATIVALGDDYAALLAAAAARPELRLSDLDGVLAAQAAQRREHDAEQLRKSRRDRFAGLKRSDS